MLVCLSACQAPMSVTVCLRPSIQRLYLYTCAPMYQHPVSGSLGLKIFLPSTLQNTPAPSGRICSISPAAAQNLNFDTPQTHPVSQSPHTPRFRPSCSPLRTPLCEASSLPIPYRIPEYSPFPPPHDSSEGNPLRSLPQYTP